MSLKSEFAMYEGQSLSDFVKYLFSEILDEHEVDAIVTLVEGIIEEEFLNQTMGTIAFPNKLQLVTNVGVRLKNLRNV